MAEHYNIRLDTDQLEKDAAKAKKLFDEIGEEAIQQGKVVDEAMTNNMAQSVSKFNAIGVSIQQIARELPSLTLSPQMFFLAISNNLPMLTDALAQARKEYEATTAAGQKAVPVWKQVAKSLLSWQTAISLLPTLLIVYGDKIEEFFTKLTKGSKKVDLAAESIKAFKEVMLKGEQNAQKEITDLRLLYEATQDYSNSIKERTTATEELQSRYPQYFGNMSKEEILAGKAADAYSRLASSIVASAKAQAARDRIVEEQSKVLEAEQKMADAYTKLDQAKADLAKNSEFYNKSLGKTTAEEQRFLAIQLGNANARVQNIEKEIEGYKKVIEQANTISQQLEESINIQDLVFKDNDKGDDSERKKALDKLRQYLDQFVDLQKDNEDRVVELMQDGTEKQLAEINLRYSREIETVKKFQAELKKAQGGKLTDEQQKVFATAYSGLNAAQKAATQAITENQIEAEKKAMQDYLIEYGNYWEKRENIAAQYADKIAKATTKGEKMALAAERTEVLAKLDDEAQKKTSIITKLFGNMATKSVEKMREIANEAEKLLSFIESGEYESDNTFGITKEQFDILSKSPDKLESIKNEIANVRAEANNAEPTFEKIKKLLVEIFKTSDKNKLIANIQQLNSEVNKVLVPISFLSDSLANLGDAFGSEVLSGIAEGLNVATDALNSTMQGAQAGSLFGPIGASAGAAIGLVTSLASSIAKIHDKKNERQIEKLQEQIDTLSSSYDELGRAVEDAYSKDASNLIEQQNKLLEKQKVLIQAQIKEEQDKKKTDESRIKDWEQQLEDINIQLEENKEKAVDAIFGEDIKSAIDNFATASTDAWAQQANASQSAKDVVKKMMQQMVTESIKATLQSSKSIEEIRKKMQEFYADEVFSDWEQKYIYDMADRVQQELNNKFGWAEDLFKEEGEKYQQSATAGGFATASQDSVDELNGRFTAVQMATEEIRLDIKIGNASLESIRNTTNEVRDIVQSCYGELVEIKENTAAIIKPIQQMQKDITEVKNNTSRL